MHRMACIVYICIHDTCLYIYETILLRVLLRLISGRFRYSSSLAMIVNKWESKALTIHSFNIICVTELFNIVEAATTEILCYQLPIFQLYLKFKHSSKLIMHSFNTALTCSCRRQIDLVPDDLFRFLNGAYCYWNCTEVLYEHVIEVGGVRDFVRRR